MIAWQVVVSAALIIFGLACCGMGCICGVMSATTVDRIDAREIAAEARVVGTLGLVMLSAAFVVRFL